MIYFNTISNSLFLAVFPSTAVGIQFADGVYLILLMGLLEDYFVPLYNFYLTPENFEQKVISPPDSRTLLYILKIFLTFCLFSGPQCVICL